jgi:CRP-like cAMP-binding protein
MSEHIQRQRNLLLDSICRECGLGAWVEPVEFPIGHEIAAPGRNAGYFYFPTSGVLSTGIQLREGTVAASLTIGNEGMVGVPVWLGVTTALESVLQQLPGQIMRIPARAFCERIVGHRRTERLVKRFIAYSMRFGSQTAACNAYHSVGQRMSRWLLDMLDRAHSTRINITQASLAHTLGVRRQSVTEAALYMQQSGIIRYKRGEIRILDRQGLETSTCECYSEMNRLYDRLVRAAL